MFFLYKKNSIFLTFFHFNKSFLNAHQHTNIHYRSHMMQIYDIDRRSFIRTNTHRPLKAAEKLQLNFFYRISEK